ncbi:MAG: molecular chaperone TorD family protein [Eggerthellaceae bacterium]|nr:molecular chaperone TorD family protein [Eggerthellaceae bacterium]
MEREYLENALVNREFVYRYAWRLFAAEPDADMLALCASAEAQDQVELLLGADSDAASAQRHMAEIAAETDDASALADEFTRLFLGPAKPLAPLWESVYRESDELLFQQTTLDVREAYKGAGFEARAYPKEADDHLAIELDFMAALVNRTLTALQADDVEAAHANLAYQRMFLADHLTKWTGDLRERAAREIPTNYSNFYLYAVALVDELCHTEVSIV